MNKSIERFITVSTLLRNILIAHHAVAQSFALEAGKMIFLWIKDLHFNVGAGFKIIAADPINYYLSAIAAGFELNYQPTAISSFKFDTGFYYAGESLTFSDGNNVSLLTVNMDYQVIEDTFVRLGYRRIKTEHTNGISTNFDRGAYLGLLWQF